MYSVVGHALLVLPVLSGGFSAQWCICHYLSCLEVTTELPVNGTNWVCNVGATRPMGICVPPASQKSTQLCGFDISLHLTTSVNWVASVSSTLFDTFNSMDILPFPPPSPPIYSHHYLDWWSAKSKYKENNGIWHSSRTMLVLGTHAKVMDSLNITLLCVATGSSPGDHSPATILLPNSPTTGPSSTSHALFKFLPLPISFLTVFDRLPYLTDSFCSFLNNPFSFSLSRDNAFHTSTATQLSRGLGIGRCTELLEW